MVLPFLLWGASTVWSPNGMAFGQIREWLQWGAISVCIITSNVSGLHPTLLRLGEVRCSSDNTLTSSQGVGSTVVEHEKDAPIIMSSPTQYARGAPVATFHHTTLNASHGGKNGVRHLHTVHRGMSWPNHASCIACLYSEALSKNSRSK